MAKMIPIERIEQNSWNPNKMNDETYRSLVEDVKAHGTNAIDPIHIRPLIGGKGCKILQPLEGKNLFEVVDGEHRLRAVKEAGFNEIPCIIDKVSEDEAKSINYRKNKERGNMDPFKEAELFKSEIDAGKTYDDVAEKYGISHALVGSRLSLLKLSNKTINVVSRLTDSGKKVPTAHLELIAPLSKPIQAKVAEKLADEPSKRELAKEIEKIKAKPKPPEIAPEPVLTNDGYECPLCRALHRAWHISSREHKFELIKEGVENADGEIKT